MPKTFAITKEKEDMRFNKLLFIRVDEEILCAIEDNILRHDYKFPFIMKVVSEQYEDLCILNFDFPQLISEIEMYIQTTKNNDCNQKQFLKLVEAMCITNTDNGLNLFGSAD